MWRKDHRKKGRVLVIGSKGRINGQKDDPVVERWRPQYVG